MNTQLVSEIQDLLKKTGQDILSLYSEEYDISEKADKSLLTEADLRANKSIIGFLEKYNWPILSEESKDDLSRLESSRLWIVDPLDGTNDFIEKTGDFCLMIGLVEEGQPILGFVYQPTEDKLYFAQKNKGAFLKQGDQAQKIQVSDQADFQKANLLVSRSHLGEAEKKLIKEMGIEKLSQRGSNGIKLGLIAEGKADMFFNPTNRLGQWDACAPHVILEEAGGQVTNVDGGKIEYNLTSPKIEKGLAASNKLVHNDLIKQTTLLWKNTI